MELLKYQELTGLLDSLTDGADTLRAVFEKHPVEVPAGDHPGGQRCKPMPTDQARQHPEFPNRYLLLKDADKAVTESAHLMDKCGDEIERENQDRHDQGMTATDEIRALYDSMSRFLDATNTPVAGAGTLYDKTRKRCRALMNKLNGWFPDLNPNQAGTHPATPGDVPREMSGRGMMVELFRARLAETQEYKRAKNVGQISKPWTWNDSYSELVEWLTAYNLIDKDAIGRYMWRYADGAFLDKKGNPITADQLSDANKAINRQIKKH